ncbi:MAG: molybdopterin-dependent oxidoreductase [Acidimicrobiia bacterium]|nr:molybdopterin-dependent oxidoreductase [Acidimicrobiia bacterium]MYB25690.1 molybdopterin-dependent oxidoreductase [Acidimicrobiia bacterium]MYJ14685.1 molybdopterin-dependent oxidoreductase [Acidimicrobiia bacterium]
MSVADRPASERPVRRRLRLRLPAAERAGARSRKTNVALLALLVLAWVSGGSSFLLGGFSTAWLVTLHGVVGFGVLVLARPKVPVVRRGLRRRRPSRYASMALGVCVTGAFATGVVHALGFWQAIGVWSAMGLHLIFAFAAVPLALWHVVGRPQRIRPVDLSRRTALQALAVAGVALAARGGFERFVAAERRFTGSHEVGSGEPRRMPVVQWLNDSPPTIRPEDWVLRLRGSTDRDVDYQELIGHAATTEATLDCTSGWYSTQTWTGVALADLLGAEEVSGRSLEVRSATGYARRFPLSDARHLILAHSVGGEPLSRGHGFPARLVAPGRRGLWWVKWVTEIRTSDRPWWVQTPIPFT